MIHFQFHHNPVVSIHHNYLKNKDDLPSLIHHQGISPAFAGTSSATLPSCPRRAGVRSSLRRMVQSLRFVQHEREHGFLGQEILGHCLRISEHHAHSRYDGPHGRGHSPSRPLYPESSGHIEVPPRSGAKPHNGLYGLRSALLRGIFASMVKRKLGRGQ